MQATCIGKGTAIGVLEGTIGTGFGGLFSSSVSAGTTAGGFETGVVGTIWVPGLT